VVVRMKVEPYDCLSLVLLYPEVGRSVLAAVEASAVMFVVAGVVGR